MPDKPELPPFGKCREGASLCDTPGGFRHFTRGRYALGEAYRLSGVGHHGALLAPAYHCVTMLDPALALGADIQLYPLQADLSPDLEKLDALLSACAKPVKALLATHFFGLAQNFADLKQWCDRQQIVLIEDCSHVLFTENYQAPGTGIFGRFVAASPYKFFACEDGGLLHAPAEHQLDSVKTEAAGLIKEFRGIKRTLEKCRPSGTMVSDIAAIDSQLEALGRSPIVPGTEQITAYSQPSSMYAAAEARTAALRSSRFIVSRTPIKENIRRRRHNYQRWSTAVTSLPNCHAPFPELPESAVPYMFPLHIDSPNPHFYWLKHLGVPVWRWDEMAVSNCPLAQDYRLHLLHLPCHQSLSENQLDWMIAALRKTLCLPPRGAQ